MLRQSCLRFPNQALCLNDCPLGMADDDFLESLPAPTERKTGRKIEITDDAGGPIE
jgi:hypothetical protein